MQILKLPSSQKKQLRQKEMEWRRTQKAKKRESTLPPMYESTVNFTENDRAPLGLMMKWLDPPVCWGLMEDTPASKFDDR
jgi:hypothetical protein